MVGSVILLADDDLIIIVSICHLGPVCVVHLLIVFPVIHKITKMADGDNDDEIIVCQKDDGTYHYYYEKEFRREFKNGNLQFGNMDEAKEEYSLESTGEVIDSLINDWIESSASIYRNILDSENRQVYTKCWRYDGEKVSENCAPVGAKNLLEVEQGFQMERQVK